MNNHLRACTIISALSLSPSLTLFGMKTTPQQPSDEKSPGLHALAIKGDEEVLALALKKASPEMVDQKDAYGKTALHYAAKSGFLGCIQLLLKARACVNATDANNQTPLDSIIKVIPKYEPRRESFLCCIALLALNDGATNIDATKIDNDIMYCIENARWERAKRIEKRSVALVPKDKRQNVSFWGCSKKSTRTGSTRILRY